MKIEIEENEPEIKIVEENNQETENEVSLNKTTNFEEILELENEKLNQILESKFVIEEKETETQLPAEILGETKDNSNYEEAKLPSIGQEETKEITNTVFSFPLLEKFDEIQAIQDNNTKDFSQASNNVLDSLSCKEQVLSEDFWKNRDEFKNLQENSSVKTEETKKEEFVVPSVLQTLRTKSTPSNKPWLLKKKKTTEVKVEEPIEPSKIESKSIEINSEPPKETPEIVEEAQIGNINEIVQEST